MSRPHPVFAALLSAPISALRLPRASRPLLCPCRALSVSSVSSVSSRTARPRRPVCSAAPRRTMSSAPASSSAGAAAPPSTLPTSSTSPTLPALKTLKTSPASPPPAAQAPPRETLFFGPFDVSTQVFYTTARSFALVNLKPLLPGHVLVCPKRPHRRLTDLDTVELTDLFAAVQVVQRMLARYYFVYADDGAAGAAGAADASVNAVEEPPLQRGSFNIAVQDGPEAGQTVAHLHVHVLPRIRGTSAKDASTEGDALYEKMAEEPGNVGGAQWDVAMTAVATTADNTVDGTVDDTADSAIPGVYGRRPRPGGRFPRIEDASRQPRTMSEMEAEAAAFRQTLAELGIRQ